MAKARAIVKRRKAVRNIRKITKTMQMISTAKFQKSLRRAVGTKPYTLKVRELVGELAATVGNVQHPLLRNPSEEDRTGRVAVIVIASNRGLAGAYNGNVLRRSAALIRELEEAGNTIELYVAGKKGATYYNYRKRPIAGRNDKLVDAPRFVDVERVADQIIDRFTTADPERRVDRVYVVYMNFISAGVQKTEAMQLLPLASIKETVAEAGSQPAGGAAARQGAPAAHAGPGQLVAEVTYDFSPNPQVLFDELLPLTVKAALFQAFLDAVTSENVARMVAMKSATDNADKIVKSLTMQYNRARQSQITTELSEIMGGVEAMKS